MATNDEGLLPYVFESPSELRVEDMNTSEQVDMAILMVEGQINDRSQKIETTDKDLQTLTESEEGLREGLKQSLEERQAEEADDQVEEFIPLDMGDSGAENDTTSSLKNLKSQLSDTLARQKNLRKLEDQKTSEEEDLKTL